MRDRPKIDLPPSKWVQFLNLIAMLMLLSSIVYVVLTYRSLPETVPTHFNGKGEADGWGHKGTIFLLPVIAVICYIPLYFLSKVPHTFNYTVEITKENAPRLYQSARLFMTIINAETVAIFSFLTWETVRAAKGYDTFGVWLIVAIIVVPLITIIVFMVRMNQLR
ncbi:DUF1648 domain-containing protein [Lentibacillus sp. L22]|uniref:DUF1648 domain-containing protein n=1 Tax=Lentibacillus TaxID=175304 RepID=UPI0022B096DC|nr:DUF1648 domain-containing protein [Lentibacillus daqui]